MRKVDRSALVPFSAQQMYDLVNDVAAYPEFLPWCRDSKVVSESATAMEASIEVAKGGIDRWFTTRNTLNNPSEIRIDLLDGPFDFLRGAWHFEALREDACKVSLKLEFQFSNAMLGLVFGPIFNQICNSLIDAFVERAQHVHG